MYAPDYYTAPDCHPQQIKIDELEDQIDSLAAECKSLESINRDWTDEEDDRYNELQAKMMDLDLSLKALYEGE
jgi:chromosome segregation ATPase